LLKTDPELGMTILEPLRSDSSKYVRDSVANWLNDAGKTQPEWVRQLCRRWTKESPTAETAMIIKRATRNL
jgi:3-methyladenine DNA glycosylase AlkC